MTQTAAVVPTADRQGIVAWAGHAYGVEPGKVLSVLKNTCFRTGANEPEATDAEVAGLLIVARAHNLNPFLKEIFAFRDQRGGIVPVVGVDGWSRIINDHPQMDGIQFEFDAPDGGPLWCRCTIHRKDRKNPTVIAEYFEECRRDTKPWKSHPRRMLRHKAMIQCARVAFGFAGIYDEDEGERIAEIDVTPPAQPPSQGAAATLKSAVLGAPPVVTPSPPPATRPGASNGVLDAAQGQPPVVEATPEQAQAAPDAPKGEATAALDLKAPPPLARPKADAKVQRMFADAIAKARDRNELGLLYADTDLYEWEVKDREAVGKLYNKRQAELKR